MKHPCMTVWPEKFFGDTGHLSGEAAGVYAILLMHAWSRGGSLPNDHAQLRLMARISRQRWQEMREDILAFWFVGEDGRLHQKRLDMEWQRAQKRRPDDPKSLKNLPLRVSAKNEKNADTLDKEKPNEINGTPYPPRARARPLPLPQNSLAPARESSEGDAQAKSKPAAALSVGHAAQPAQNTPPTPTNGADPMPDPETNARVTAAMARLKADMADKNLAAFERPKLEGDPTIQGATQEERERAAALKRLEEMHKAMKTRPLPRLGQRS